MSRRVSRRAPNCFSARGEAPVSGGGFFFGGVLGGVRGPPPPRGRGRPPPPRVGAGRPPPPPWGGGGAGAPLVGEGVGGEAAGEGLHLRPGRDARGGRPPPRGPAAHADLVAEPDGSDIARRAEAHERVADQLQIPAAPRR